MASLTSQEQLLLTMLRTHPKGANQQTVSAAFPSWSEADVADALNSLSAKHYVEFMHGAGQKLIFRAMDSDEVDKAGSMNDNERIVYQFIKVSGNKGTWIKDIKGKSGLHVQVVTQMIKNLEKKNLIKAVKSIKNPTKKVYMLAEYEPSVELTGGAWYTDQELDVEFIDQLANQLHKYIYSKSVPLDPNSIFPASYRFPTCSDLHHWVSKSGITSVELSRPDVQSLLDRLVFDGKIEQVQSTAGGGGGGGGGAGGGYNSIGSSSGGPSRMGFMSDDDEDEWRTGETVVGEVGHDAWAYRATRSARPDGSAWTDVPCGRCPVFDFCKEGGPVSPSSCVYFKKWLDF